MQPSNPEPDFQKDGLKESTLDELEKLFSSGAEEVRKLRAAIQSASPAASGADTTMLASSLQ